MAQRRQWVDEMEARFHLPTDDANERAHKAFPEIVADPAATLNESALATLMKNAEAKLAEIDAEFDTRQPVSFRVRLRVQAQHALMLCVSSGGRRDAPLPPQRAQVSCDPATRPLDEALSMMRNKAVDSIEKMFGRQVAGVFLRQYGQTFSAQRFDRAKGLAIQASIKRTVSAVSQRDVCEASSDA